MFSWIFDEQKVQKHGMYCLIYVFIVTFDQLNAPLLN